MNARRNVVFIPGLHPLTPESVQYALYRVATAHWLKAFNVNVHTLQVGWHRKGETTKTQQDRLRAGLNRINDPIVAIACSAGGPALLGAMLDEEINNKVQAVAALASPLNVPEEAFAHIRERHRIPSSLEGHYEDMNTYLQGLGAQAGDKILSIHGSRDTTVPPSWSICDEAYNIDTYELPGTRHGRTILGGLAVYGGQILEPLLAKADSQ